MKNNSITLKDIVNPAAYQKIKPFITKPYQLNKSGEEFVIDSNRDLPDTYFEHLLFPVTDFWNSYFIEKINMLEPKEKNICLDVCCGTGTLCLNYIPSSDFGKCIAIDNSEVAIGILESRLKKKFGNYEKIEVQKEDITKMSFANSSIDAVYGNSFLHHIPDNYAFLNEVYRILKPGGVIVLSGEPTIGAAFLENVIMKNLIKILVFLRLKKRKIYSEDNPVTDIWLYECNSLQKMLEYIGFVDVKITGFGVLVPLLNWPSALILGKLTGKSMQPDLYWKWLGWLDKKLFFWLSVNKYSHFAIAARKACL